jgi:hypothetical protein
MYPDVPYPSRLLYSIYTGRTAQCNTTNNHIQSILPTCHQIRFRSLKSSTAFVRAAPDRLISTPLGAVPLVRRPILLIQPPLRRVKPSADRSSPSDRHQYWPPTQLHSHRRRCPRHHRVMLGRLSRISRPPLRQIHAAVARSNHRPDHTAATLIRPQLHRSATVGAAVRSIDHNDVAAV